MRRVTARPARRRAPDSSAGGAAGPGLPALAGWCVVWCRGQITARVAALFVAVLVLLPGGCAEQRPATTTHAWPLSLDEPGLLAYTALSLPDEVQADLLHGLTDWEPRGLRHGAPLILAHLDEKTYGGPIALMLPVDDHKAFQASLGECTTLSALGNGRYRYDVPPDSPLRAASMMMARMQGGSPLSMLTSMADAPQTSFGFELADEGDHAILAPSFEAIGACRRVVRATDGFAGAPPHTMVASLNLMRWRLVYAEQIAQSESQLRSLLSGAGTAGALGAAAMMGRGEGGAGGGQLPNWELLWALKDMFAFGSVEAMQFSADASPEFWARLARDEEPDQVEERDMDDERPRLGEAWESFLELPELRMRLQLAADSPMRPLVGAAVPAPAMEGAVLVLAADPQRFAAAFAQWCKPIAEVVKGRGPPAQRYLDELAGLLGAWNGLLAVVRTEDDGLLLMGSLAPGRGQEAEAWRHWLEPLLSSANVEGFNGKLVDEARADGVHALRAADGAVALSYGFADDIVWAVLGEVSAPPGPGLAAFRQARAARALPPTSEVTALRASLPDGAVDVALHGDEMQLTWRPSARER